MEKYKILAMQKDRATNHFYFDILTASDRLMEHKTFLAYAHYYVDVALKPFIDFFNDPKCDDEFKKAFILYPFYEISEQNRFYQGNFLADFLYRIDFPAPLQKFHIPKENTHFYYSRGYYDVLDIVNFSCISIKFDEVEKFFYRNCKYFGDRRRYMDTISDDEIEDIIEVFRPAVKKLTQFFSNKDEFFENLYSSIYKSARKPYKPLSHNEIAQIQEWIMGKRTYILYIQGRQVQENINRVEQVLNAKMDQQNIALNAKMDQQNIKIIYKKFVIFLKKVKHKLF